MIGWFVAGAFVALLLERLAAKYQKDHRDLRGYYAYRTHVLNFANERDVPPYEEWRKENSPRSVP